MRLVARKKPSDILKESKDFRLKEGADLTLLDTDDTFLVAFPGCKRPMQMPGRHVRRLRQIKLGRPL